MLSFVSKTHILIGILLGLLLVSVKGEIPAVEVKPKDLAQAGIVKELKVSTETIYGGVKVYRIEIIPTSMVHASYLTDNVHLRLLDSEQNFIASVGLSTVVLRDGRERHSYITLAEQFVEFSYFSYFYHEVEYVYRLKDFVGN